MLESVDLRSKSADLNALYVGLCRSIGIPGTATRTWDEAETFRKRNIAALKFSSRVTGEYRSIAPTWAKPSWKKRRD
jgi:hypothetical protein